MKFNKAILSCIIGTTIVACPMTASAAILVVTDWTLQDYQGNDSISEFYFGNTLPPENEISTFGAGDETCGTGLCAPIHLDNTMHATSAFTTGFDFGGAGVIMAPYLFFGGMAASLDTDLAAAGNGQALQFSSLNWGVEIQGDNYTQAPDHLFNCTGAANGLQGDSCGGTSINDSPSLLNPQGYNVEITSLGDGKYGVVVKWVSTITTPGGFFNQEGNWCVEGVMSTNGAITTSGGGVSPGGNASCFSASASAVPVPAAAWLMGSGLVGLVGVARRNQKKSLSALSS